MENFGFGQTAGSPFDFGKFFGSQGFSGLTKGVGAGAGLGLGIMNALNTKDFMKGQMDLQNKEFAMTADAYNRNKEKEDYISNLDFTSGGVA